MQLIYAYRAIAQNGDTKTGTIQAESLDNALRSLQQQGLTVLGLELSRDIVATMPRFDGGKLSLFTPKVTLKDLAIMSRQFAVLYGAGVTITQCIKTVQKQSENLLLKDVLYRVSTQVESGRGLGESMKQFSEVFPPILYNMVAAGEVSGSLDAVLERAAHHFEREFEIEQKIKSALSYPKLVVTAVVLVGSFLVTVVVPKFAEMFGGMGVALPLPTRMLIALGDFMKSYWWLVGLLTGAAYALTTWYATTPRGRRLFDKWSLHYPVFGNLNRKKIISRFCRSLGTLSRSGISIIPAMALVRQTLGNVVVSEALGPVQEAIRIGQGVAPQLEKTGFFPPLVVQMVAVGEETGGFDVMLEKSSDFIDSDIRNMTDNMTQLIEPIVIMVLGVVVTFIILSIVLPMFDSFTLVG